MKILLPKKIEHIIDLFYRAGFEAYAVGGCVRDAFLQKKPHDWDITTNAKPQEIKAVLKDFTTIDTGIKYGTVTAVCDGEQIEITTYRLDLGYDDNRHPKAVRFSSQLKEDLSRRDFTVNAMAYNYQNGLVDEFGGLRDLQNGVIRTVGKSATRFSEDGLRILRGLRFAAVLNFTIEKQTAEAIHTCRNLLQNIAGERIHTEFTKILLSDNPAAIIRQYTDVIGVFLPEILPLQNCAQNHPYHAYDVFEHTMKALANTPPDKIIRYTVLFHDLGKPQTKTTDENGIDHFRNHQAVSVQKADLIMQRLKFSNAEAEEILLLVKYHDVPITCDEYHVKRWLNRCGEVFFRNLLEVKKADISGQNPALLNRIDDLAAYRRLTDKILAEKQCFTLEDLAINGGDLLQIGYKPGKKIGDVLEHLLDEVMNGKVANDKATLLQKAELFK